MCCVESSLSSSKRTPSIQRDRRMNFIFHILLATKKSTVLDNTHTYTLLLNSLTGNLSQMLLVKLISMSWV